MERIKPRTLSGFMELLPAPQMQMERMMETLRRTYSLYGFTPLDTPVIESAEVLLAKGGGETEKQIYRFTKGDADLALRFDLTVPLAKYVALHANELSFPFRRYQIGKVYRGERAQRGRFREFYQADIDIIGDGKLDVLNEAEIPAIIYKTFRSLGLTRFQIRVNNRKILNGFYAMLGLTEQAGDIMRAVDKLDKIGPEKVGAILLEDCALDPEQVESILAFIAISGTNGEVLEALSGYAGRHPLFDQGLEELRSVTAYLGQFGIPEENFAVDLTIARGLDLLHGDGVRDHAAGSSGNRFGMFRRAVRQSGRVLYRPAAAWCGNLHWTHPAVLCFGRAGTFRSGPPHGACRCAGSAHDGGAGAGHCRGDVPAGSGNPHADLYGAEEI